VRFILPAAPQPLILVYHRIAHVAADPWELVVDPGRFEQHLDVLRRARTTMSLEEFIRLLDRGSLPRDAIAVTFDDGYCDNLLNAKPRLVAADIPATVFLATGYLGRDGEYWWDELARLLLVELGPDAITCTIGEHRQYFELGKPEPAQYIEPWRAWHVPTTQRQVAYLALWRALRPLADQEREVIMAELRAKFPSKPTTDTLSRPMTSSEVKQLVDGGLVDIGAHTVTHPLLTCLEAAARERELTSSKAACKSLIGIPINGLAYPYGDFDADVQRQAKVSGFTYAVSTIDAHVAPESDRFALPRIHARDWDGVSFETVLRNTRKRG
jgi:peptidoglycan/xylan/chitin deacetylase (PgdA/CDA1 family)